MFRGENSVQLPTFYSAYLESEDGAESENDAVVADFVFSADNFVRAFESVSADEFVGAEDADCFASADIERRG